MDPSAQPWLVQNICLGLGETSSVVDVSGRSACRELAGRIDMVAQHFSLARNPDCRQASLRQAIRVMDPSFRRALRNCPLEAVNWAHIGVQPFPACWRRSSGKQSNQR